MRPIGFFIAFLAVVFPCTLLSDDLPTAANEYQGNVEVVEHVSRDQATGALVEGSERARFVKAAGKDVELDEKEFSADAKETSGFVRPTDTWQRLSDFDRNANGTIDWFEAWAYRKGEPPGLAAPRSEARLVAEKVRRERLTYARDRAEDFRRLGLSIFPSVDKETLEPALDAGASYLRAQLELDAERDSNLDGIVSEQEREATRAKQRRLREEFETTQFLARFDTDHDGQVSDAERAAPANAQRRVALNTFDINNNGSLDPDEYQALLEARVRQSESMADLNHDGRIDDAERKAYLESPFPHEHEAFKQADADRDGALDEQEMVAYSKAQQEYDDRQRSLAIEAANDDQRKAEGATRQ